MAHSANPVGTDLSAYLASAGLNVSALSSGTLDDAAEAGRERFEREANRIPFLAGGSDSTRLFDPPFGWNMKLTIPDLSAFTSLIYHPRNSSAVTWTQNTDFRLLMEDAPQLSKPWESVEFLPYGFVPLLRWGGYPCVAPLEAQALQITGKWGYAATIPADVWEAMLCFGSLSLLPRLNRALRTGIVSLQDSSGRRIQYNDASMQNDLTLMAQATVERYKRRVLW